MLNQLNQSNHGSTHANRWNVLIVGGGPAGAAAAITPARQGRRVLIVEKQTTQGVKFGESLPPAAVRLVEALLGSLDAIDLEAHGIHKTAGNISRWSSTQPDIADFFYTPTGFGLGIDRARFDNALLQKARDEGAILQTSSKFIQCRRDSEGWVVDMQSRSGREQYYADYLIDASGRRSVVTAGLGIARQQQERLFALGRCFITHEDDNDGYTRIEATPQGWWYSNRLPSAESETEQKVTRRMVVFHTDRDLEFVRQAATADGFDRLLRQSPHINDYLQKHRYQPDGNIHGVDAGGERLDQFAGDGWLAVGDAAQAYDPLSSQGITKGLTSGVMAGQLLGYALNNLKQYGHRNADPPLFKRYVDEQERLWAGYLQQCNHYYRNQPNWSDQPFWSRRNRVSLGTTNIARKAP
ncbi:MAG TPA: NAD(P)/FAD-dependent oxidoreductase [Gammaproteobacteria bacterium]